MSEYFFGGRNEGGALIVESKKILLITCIKIENRLIKPAYTKQRPN